MLIAGWIMEGIIGAGIWIVAGVYHVAAWAFEVFLILASGRLLDGSSYEQIMQNFYIVLGIVMLFIVAFGLLKGMISAEESKKSATSIRKMVVNLVVASIVVTLLPLIFSFAFDFQDAVIKNNNTFGRFFGYGMGTGADSPLEKDNLQKVRSGAFQIVNGVYTAFFNVNMESDTCKSVNSDSNTISNREQMEVCQKTVESDDGETYAEAVTRVNDTGAFATGYGQFSTNVDDGEIEFNFLLILLAGLALVYVGVSYCFDMGVRLVKLVFYQLIGPIPIFLSVIPEGKMASAFKQWIKVTLTCYLEVFIRIFAFYFCIYLCQEMMKSGFLTTEVWEYDIFLGLLAQAFILMGVVMFMRQVPKLFSDITGIDSGNMKLGLKQKMADGGLFAAGALVGGGVTALTRNFVNAVQNGRNVWKDKNSTAGQKAGAVWYGLRSTLAGGISGAARGGKAGWGAKSGTDMKNAAGSGAKGAIDARDRRATYKASHGGTLRGSIGGHVLDIGQSIGEWAGGTVSDSKLGYYTTAAQVVSSYNDLSEGTYKKKKGYQDQESIVKALAAGSVMSQYNKNNKHIAALNAELNNEINPPNAQRAQEIKNELAEYNTYQRNLESLKDYSDYEREKERLRNMQISESIKKKGTIAKAITQLSTDQKNKYSDNTELTAAYEKAIMDSFEIKSFNDEDLKGLSQNELNIITSLRSGKHIDPNLINENNIIKVQNTLDYASRYINDIKTNKELEYIEKTRNRSTDKKDK